MNSYLPISSPSQVYQLFKISVPYVNTGNDAFDETPLRDLYQRFYKNWPKSVFEVSKEERNNMYSDAKRLKADIDRRIARMRAADVDQRVEELQDFLHLLAPMLALERSHQEAWNLAQERRKKAIKMGFLPKSRAKSKSQDAPEGDEKIASEWTGGEDAPRKDAEGEEAPRADAKTEDVEGEDAQADHINEQDAKTEDVDENYARDEKLKGKAAKEENSKTGPVEEEGRKRGNMEGGDAKARDGQAGDERVGTLDPTDSETGDVKSGAPEELTSGADSGVQSEEVKPEDLRKSDDEKRKDISREKKDDKMKVPEAIPEAKQARKRREPPTEDGNIAPDKRAKTSQGKWPQRRPTRTDTSEAAQGEHHGGYQTHFGFDRGHEGLSRPSGIFGPSQQQSYSTGVGMRDNSPRSGPGAGQRRGSGLTGLSQQQSHSTPSGMRDDFLKDSSTSPMFGSGVGQHSGSRGSNQTGRVPRRRKTGFNPENLVAQNPARPPPAQASTGMSVEFSNTRIDTPENQLSGQSLLPTAVPALTSAATGIDTGETDEDDDEEVTDTAKMTRPSGQGSGSKERKGKGKQNE